MAVSHESRSRVLTGKSFKRLACEITLAVIAGLLPCATQAAQDKAKVTLIRTPADNCVLGQYGSATNIDDDQIFKSQFADWTSFSKRGPRTLSSTERSELDDILSRWTDKPQVPWEPTKTYCEFEFKIDIQGGSTRNFKWWDSARSVPASAKELLEWIEKEEATLDPPAPKPEATLDPSAPKPEATLDVPAPKPDLPTASTQTIPKTVQVAPVHEGPLPATPKSSRAAVAKCVALTRKRHLPNARAACSGS